MERITNFQFSIFKKEKALRLVRSARSEEMCSTPPIPTRDDRMLLNKFAKLLIKAVGMRTLSLKRKHLFGL